ncbi:MAG: hypothetical protein AABZ31_06115 [Bdellovibrionota bacterium]
MTRYSFLLIFLLPLGTFANELTFKVVDLATKQNVAVLKESKQKVTYERLGQKCSLKIESIKKHGLSYRTVKVQEECRSENGVTRNRSSCEDSALDEKPLKKLISDKEANLTETTRPKWNDLGCQSLGISTTTINGQKSSAETFCCRE